MHELSDGRCLQLCTECGKNVFLTLLEIVPFGPLQVRILHHAGIILCGEKKVNCNDCKKYGGHSAQMHSSNRIFPLLCSGSILCRECGDGLKFLGYVNTGIIALCCFLACSTSLAMQVWAWSFLWAWSFCFWKQSCASWKGVSPNLHLFDLFSSALQLEREAYSYVCGSCA